MIHVAWTSSMHLVWLAAACIGNWVRRSAGRARKKLRISGYGARVSTGSCFAALQ